VQGVTLFCAKFVRRFRYSLNYSNELNAVAAHGRQRLPDFPTRQNPEANSYSAQTFSVIRTSQLLRRPPSTHAQKVVLRWCVAPLVDLERG
jgi:hypothetical protein